MYASLMKLFTKQTLCWAGSHVRRRNSEAARAYQSVITASGRTAAASRIFSRVCNCRQPCKSKRCRLISSASRLFIDFRRKLGYTVIVGRLHMITLTDSAVRKVQEFFQHEPE